MKRLIRGGALALAALVPLGAGASAPAPIRIVINGNALPLKPPPRMVGAVLIVPVRRIVDALGLPFSISGKRISTAVGAKVVSLSVGSDIAYVDRTPLHLDAPMKEIDGVLYAPLRLFTDVLGAQATYDRRARTVTIVAQLIGRSGIGVEHVGKTIVRFGTVAAVDVLSTPPTITLGDSGAVKTIPISRNAAIEREDVNANVRVPGELDDVRPGDFARIAMTAKGQVLRVVDEYGSRSGTIVAVGGGAIVLDDGQVIVPARTTEVAIDGKAAAFGDLKAGDVVTVRYNVESNAVREVLASRPVAGARPVPGAPAISAVNTSATGALRPGDVVRVTLDGTPGGSATFDVGSFASDQAMHQSAPGVYVGTYTIPRGASFDAAPVIGRLTVGGQRAPAVQAPQTLSASGTPPGIADVGPAPGARVNSVHPAIYATFASGAVPVDPASAQLIVDGHDVTSECVRTSSFIEYFPDVAYRPGAVRVTVRVADRAGNRSDKRWSFWIEP